MKKTGKEILHEIASFEATGHNESEEDSKANE